MASDSKDSNRRGRALLGPAQQKETNPYLLPLVCESSRTSSNSRTRRGPGTEKKSDPTRLPLLQPRQKERDVSKPGKKNKAKPTALDSPTRINLSSPPAWSEGDFRRRHPRDKEEPTLQRRHASSTTRLEPLKHSPLTRLQPLQHSAPQLPNANMRAHNEFVAKEVYSRGSEVFGSHFAACPSSPSSAQIQQCNSSLVDPPSEIRAKVYTYVSPEIMKLKDSPSNLKFKKSCDKTAKESLDKPTVDSIGRKEEQECVVEHPSNVKIEKACDSTVQQSHDKPSVEGIDRREEGRVAKHPGNVMIEQARDKTVRQSRKKPSVESIEHIEEPEGVAKHKAISEMHRLFAAEAERGGSPTGNAVRALRLLAEAGKKNDPELSHRSRSCPCSVSAQSGRAASDRSESERSELERSELDATVVQ